MGSVIGVYGILKEEHYSFSARAASDKDTVLVAISSESLKTMRQLKLDLEKSMSVCEDYVDKNGVPQIDYRVFNDSLSFETPKKSEALS